MHERTGEVKVKYEELLEEDETNVVEVVPLAHVRPKPPAVARDGVSRLDKVAWLAALPEGTAAEVYKDDAWWAAAFVRASDEGYTIRYLTLWEGENGDEQVPTDCIRPLWQFAPEEQKWTLNEVLYVVD